MSVLGKVKFESVNNASEKALMDLVEGCKREDRSSQRKLYEEFYSYGISVCLRYSKSDEEALEILNDGFMKVFTKISRYDKDRSFKGWLRRILINTALDHYRKNEKFYNHKGTDSIKNSESDFSIEKHLAYEDLLLMIRQLSASYQLVFNLYTIDGYSHEEIADLLNISVGTSKSNLSRARANLRQMLKTLYKEEYAKFPG